MATLFQNLIVGLFLVGGGLFTTAFAGGWDPVNPADLALKQCPFDKSADAELLFEKNDIEDKPNTIWNIYRRVKIFNRAGAEKYSQLEFYYPWDEASLRNLRVRIIHPDGTIKKVDSKHITNEMSSRGWESDERRRVVAIPQVVPGSIIEYRFQFSYDNGILWSKSLIFQYDLPARDVEYFFRSMDAGQFSFESLYFQMPDHRKFEWKGTGYVLHMHNVPPEPDEPLMPPDDEVHSWVLSYYTDDAKRKPKEY